MAGEQALVLARSDLADCDLEGLVRARHHVRPVLMQVVAPVAALRSAPGEDAEQIDQLLFGEVFAVLEVKNGFAWGQARRDGYVGHLAAGALSDRVCSSTHWISALRTYAYAHPAIRAPATGPIGLNALLTVNDESGAFAHAERLGWVPKAHITPMGRALGEAASVVEGFVGAPYLWGGRDSLGLDCSGLVQQALLACGLGCPRDTDLQQRLGAAIRRSNLRRGDLVFWRGHVGMMVDSERLAHANAHHMAVAVEPLARAIRRIARAGGGRPTAYRRL